MIRSVGTIGRAGVLVFVAALVAFTAESVCGQDAAPARVRVMSFNIWIGGEEGGQPLSQTAEVVRAANADIVGLQETHSRSSGDQPAVDNAAKLAEMLGWHFVNQGGRTAVISRYPITGTTPNQWGVEVRLPSGQNVVLFNAHFPASPYQPYQLLKIPYGEGRFLETAEQAVEAARAARGEALERMLVELKSVLPTTPVLVTGDFNEPSHLDWTPEVAMTGGCPLAVAWPTTIAVMELGLIDSFRAVHGNPIAAPGFTWTPLTEPSDPTDRHDRIDFVFHSSHLIAKRAERVGESSENADIVVAPYPSDHRAVVVEFEFAK